MSHVSAESTSPARRALPALAAMASLAGIFLAAALVFNGALSLGAAKKWMLVATILWFVTAPIWLLRREGETDD